MDGCGDADGDGDVVTHGHLPLAGVFARDEFEFLGYLFIRFPVGMSFQQSRDVLEAEVIAQGGDQLGYVDAECAYHALAFRPLKHLKPWELEAYVRTDKPGDLGWAAKMRQRFAPYWEPNGGPHKIEELYKQDTPAPLAEPWDFETTEPPKPKTGTAWEF